MLVDQINQDLKSAMLARDELKVSTLRSLKSALTYAAVDDKAKGGSGELSEEVVIQQVLAHESKKRQDSADAYVSAGAPERSDKELAEKKIIDAYLPAQLTDDELLGLVNRVIEEIGSTEKSQMGPIIGKVKRLAEGKADGGRIAEFVKSKLGSAE